MFIANSFGHNIMTAGFHARLSSDENIMVVHKGINKVLDPQEG